MLDGWRNRTPRDMSVADPFIERRNLVGMAQRFRRFAGLREELDGLVEREHALGRIGGPLQVDQRSPEVTGLGEVVRQVLCVLIGI